MARKKLSAFEKALNATAVGIMLAIPTTIVVGSYLDSQNENYAREESMKHYEPVTNGGALAEQNGNISLRRQEMYDKIDQVYNELRWRK